MKCALCEKHPRLENSHIVSRFIYKWLKKTSGTGHLRAAHEPEKRIQDGYKYPLLCPSCEDDFSKYETKFAQKIFYPLIEDKPNSITYDEHLMKFGVSLIWRCCHHVWLEREDDKPMQPEFEGRIDLAYQRWREFLLGEESNPGEFRVFVLPLHNVEAANLQNPPAGMSTYFTRAVDIDMVCNSTNGYIYAKLPHFIFFGEVFHKGKDEFSQNLRVRVRKGVLGGKAMTISRTILDYIQERCAYVVEQRAKIPEKELEKIRKAYEKDPERLLRSKAFEAALADKRNSDRAGLD